MTVLKAARVVTPSGVLCPGVVELDGDRITSVARTTGVAPDRTLAPGLIDLQVNGLDDIDVAGAIGGDWDRLAELLLSQGVTAWCPTLVTAPLKSYQRPLARMAAAATRAAECADQPAILGAHLEGPFLGAKPGAHPVDLIVEPDLEWLAAVPPVVRIVTLAAEVRHAAEAIALLVQRGVLVSVGHSAATFDEAIAAVDAGARLVTHGFNGMSGLDHRAPGMVGAALTDDRLAVSLIADLVHVHPAALTVAFRCKPPGRAVLVSDAVAWRGERVGVIGIIHDGSACRLADGTLAGSVLPLDLAVANVVAHCGVSVHDAVAAASTTPAALLGEDGRGRLAAGARADVVALDAELRCTHTWLGGTLAFER